jgi:hypothetical protein
MMVVPPRAVVAAAGRQRPAVVELAEAVHLAEQLGPRAVGGGDRLGVAVHAVRGVEERARLRRLLPRQEHLARTVDRLQLGRLLRAIRVRPGAGYLKIRPPPGAGRVAVEPHGELEVRAEPPVRLRVGGPAPHGRRHVELEAPVRRDAERVLRIQEARIAWRGALPDLEAVEVGLLPPRQAPRLVLRAALPRCRHPEAKQRPVYAGPPGQLADVEPDAAEARLGVPRERRDALVLARVLLAEAHGDRRLGRRRRAERGEKGTHGDGEERTCSGHRSGSPRTGTERRALGYGTKSARVRKGPVSANRTGLFASAVQEPPALPASPCRRMRG